MATQTEFFGKKYDPTELKNIDELKDIGFCGSLMFRACVLASSNCFSVKFAIITLRVFIFVNFFNCFQNSNFQKIFELFSNLENS